MKHYFTCEHCGKKFVRHDSHKYRFCSHKCRALSKGRNLKEHTCDYCGKLFYTWPSRPGRFCSAQCRSEFAARQLKPKKRRPETMRVNKKCLQCGNEYTTSIHQIRWRGSNFCSRKCMGDYQSKKLLKTGGPNYKGGVSKNNKYYRGTNWDKQKRIVLKRDNHQCQVCKVNVGAKEMHNIGVHHIKPYRLFNEDWNSANDPKNLITLCRKHHMMIESGSMPCPTPQ